MRIIYRMLRTIFLQQVNFVFPATAVNIRSDRICCVDYRFKDLKYIHVKNGVIENDDDYKSSIEVFEKNQVLDRMTEVLKNNYGFSYKGASPDSAATQIVTAIKISKISLNCGRKSNHPKK